MTPAFAPIFQTLLGTLVWLVPLLVLAAVLRSPWAKGHAGEWWVRALLRWRLDKNAYVQLHDVTLATADGSTQIDHVVVSRFGIFAIETKNLRGWIFGGERQAEWTQKIYKRTFRFQNPLRQNYKHTQALQAMLQVPADSIHSVVVFVGDSTFKTDVPANVTYARGCAEFILSFKRQIFDDQQVKDLVLELRAGRLAPTRATRVAHVQQLKARHAVDLAVAPRTPHPAAAPAASTAVGASAEHACPACGSPMVLRTTKAGSHAGRQFWGCTTYPKCRVMQKL